MGSLCSCLKSCAPQTPTVQGNNCCDDDKCSSSCNCCLFNTKKQDSPKPVISNPIPTSSIQNGTSVIYNLKNNPLARN